MNTVVFTAATKNFSYALRGSIMSVKRALCGVDYTHIIATDKSGVAKEIAKSCGINSRIIEMDVDDSARKYKNESQMIIASLQQACLDEANGMKADLCWSVESDVLVHQNSFSSLRWVLDSPEPKYDVAVSTYFNGSFLCGRGTATRQICEDHYEDERKIPEELAERLKKKREELSERKEPPTKEMVEELREIEKKIKECPPIGNVFELNAKKWRKRGWLENAYPGSAVYGSVLPTDWCGLGCTLMSKKAVQSANFDGYDGAGTQDLYLVWNKWNPAGIKIGCNLSVPAIHVKKHEEGLTAWVPYFSPAEEETSGHIRVRSQRYADLSAGTLVPGAPGQG